MKAPSDKLTLKQQLRAFHEDEDGMETLQVVMIVGIAAIIIAFVLKVFWPEITKWVSEKWKNIKDTPDKTTLD